MSEEPRQGEDGVVVPLDRINPDTLRNLVMEFVTRDWSELTDAGTASEKKVEQVLRQLKAGQIVVVFDLTTGSCNIVPRDSLPHAMKEKEDV